jgi:hypothetical protein
MAAADWLFDETISGLKRRANIPTSSESWTAADFRAYANDSMRGYILPLLRRLSEEFFVTTLDTTVTSGTAAYRISYRALGEALRDVQFSDGAGGYRSLHRIEPHQGSSYLAQAGGLADRYYLQDDKVVLLPTPASSTDVLRVKAMVRPNKLVATSGVYKVTVVGATTLTVTPLDTSVTANAATTLGASPTIDIIKGQPGFRHIALDLSATISTNTVTCTTTGVSVGDYVCTAEESPVAQIPAELHPLLAQDIACAVLRASNSPSLGPAEAERNRLESIAMGLFSPRTENQPRYVTNRHGPGLSIRRRVI